MGSATVMTLQQAVTALIVGYVLGAIPTGMIVAKVYRNVDLTAYGSGRTGATNVLRTLGKGAAAVAFAGDFVKGLLAVQIAHHLIAPGNPWVELLAATAAVIGHTYSPFIGFKGGRGVVTGFGATFAVAPGVTLIAFAAGAVLMAVTRYVSVGSLGGALVAGLLMVGMAVNTNEPALAVWGVLLSGVIFITHRDNIERLLAGTERKLGEPAVAAPEA
jgi:glycerol-3-phosphate acyltransferase PlsY